MKKLSVLKLISLIFVCVMLIGAVAVTALATEGENTVELKKNIILGDKIQLMFAVPTTVSEDAEISVTWGEDNDLTYTRDTAKDFTGYRAYVINEGWAAQNINAMVTITVTDGEDVYKLDYSILMYVYEVINLDGRDETNATYRLCKALLEYAKVADEVINKDNANNFDSYYCVTVVNGTLDGYNTWGMFKADEAPFANIEHALDLGTNEVVEWTYSVNGEDMGVIEYEELKGLTVEGKIVVTANKIEGVCHHDMTKATCTEDAYCSLGCGYVEEGSALGHDMAPATCEAASTCKNGCGKTEGEALGHDMTDATCIAPSTCKNGCGLVDPEGKLGHHVNTVVDDKCDVCEATLTKTEVSATLTFDADTANRVSYSTTKQVWAQNGITFTNNKGSSQTNVADYGAPVRLYKDSEIVIEYPGMTKIVFSCSESKYVGLTASDNCTVNGTTVTVTLAGVDSYTIKLGAQTRLNNITVYAESYSLCVWGDGEVTKEATCSAEGEMTATCAVCGATSKVATPKLDHTPVDVPAEEPDCTTPGKTAGVKCSVCNAVITAQTTVPANGHTDSDWIVDVKADCLNEGSQHKECTVCGDTTATEAIEALGHEVVNGACTRCDYVDEAHTCTGGTATCTAQAICTICTKPYGELAAHDYVYPANNCLEDQVCSVCDDVNEGSAKDAHTYVDGACSDCGAKEPAAGPAAIFEFGANGTASHSDGSEKTSYTETNNGYTLTLSGMSKVYGSARDAKGNSCLKLGTSSAAGKFSFTVPANVTKVVIYVAQYKANTTKVTVNGVSYTITTASNNGEYTAIEVDTSTTKTVSFTTVSGGYRCMVNTVEFYK